MDLQKYTKEALIQELQNSQAKFSFINDISNIAYFATNANREITEWSSACETLYGYQRSEAIGQRVESLIIPDFQQEMFVSEYESRRSICGEELEYKKADGTSVRVFVNSLFADDHTSYHHLSVNTSLIRHTSKLDALIGKSDIDLKDNSKLLVISFDRNGYIDAFNHFAEQLLGYRKEDVIGRNFVELFVPKSYKDKTLKQIQESFKSKSVRLKSDLPLLCKNGHKKIIHWEQTFINSYETKKTTLMLVGDDTGVDGSIQDRLEYLANYDSLTDLPNRNLLHNRMVNAINKAARHNEKMITMYINLDNFKSINHTLGYNVGDELLKTVAERLQSELRDCDTIARFSGDEFVILFENVQDELNAGMIAQRVSSLFETPFNFKENELFLHANMGISFFPSDGNDAKTLLKNANMAMLRSKEDKTTNFQFFRAQMHEEITNRVVLESNLRRALKNDEFYVVYQPQVESKSGKIVGVEALLRWTDPDLKIIPPLDFIPVAEDSGLILEIGQIVLKDAIHQMKAWHDKGYDDLYVAINISGIQLLQSKLFDQIDSLLKESGLDPRFLELELTESVLMENIDLATTLLKNFQALGIKISIDDFGTGYSSLNYLKRLPINALKIDQSFIRNINTDENDKVIVNAILAMAHSLGLEVVAEGVEEEHQRDYLVEKSCDTLQGYLYSKPLQAEKLEALLAKGDCIDIRENDAKSIDYELVSTLEKYTKPLKTLN